MGAEARDFSVDRLWQHLLHDDVIFNERLNFFLVIQSVLVAITGFLFGAQPRDTLLLRIMSTLGVLMSLIWWYVQARQYQFLRQLKRRVANLASEYAETLSGHRRISSTFLLAYVIPALFLALWVVFLILSL